MSSNIYQTPPGMVKVIAGFNSGKKVTINPLYEAEYEGLLQMASRNNYWAVVSVNSLHSLASGNFHQDNIYVEEFKKQNLGYESFKMVLPGITAQIVRTPDDVFQIATLEVSHDFTEQQKQYTKPGMYRGAWDVRTNKWMVELKEEKYGEISRPEVNPDGSIKEVSGIVAITDARNDLKKEIESIVGHISQAPDCSERRLKKLGFDIHFTPGERRLGTLKNKKEAYQPIKTARIKESSQMLAKSLYDEKGRDSIMVVSELGGSAVLTQALKALSDSGAKLEGQGFFMVRPTTNPDQALDYAIRLHMGIGRKYKKSDALSVTGYISEFKSIKRRLDARVEGHNYQGSWAIFDALAYVKSGKGAAATVGGFLATVTGGAVAVAASQAGTAVMSSAPAMAAFFKGASLALSGVTAATAAGVATVKQTNAFVKNLAPDFHVKHIESKF